MGSPRTERPILSFFFTITSRLRDQSFPDPKIIKWVLGQVSCSIHVRLMLALYSIPGPGGIPLSFGFCFFFFWTRLMFYTLLLALVFFLPHPALVPWELSCSHSSCATCVTPSCLPTFLPFNLPPRHLLLIHSLPRYFILVPPVWAICCILWGLSSFLPALWYIFSAYSISLVCPSRPWDPAG